jgi:PAS domain S-box-containing protein
MLGWTAEQMIGERSTDFIHPDDHDRAVSSWMELLAARGSQRIRLRHRCQDETWLWVEVEHIHNGAENPKDVDVLAYISDISDEMAAHEALHRREQLFSRLAESLPSGVLQLHQDRSVAYANARLTTILEVAEPTTAAEVLSIVVDHDRPAVDAALDAALDRGEDHQLEVEILRPRTADRRRCALTFAAVCDHEGRAGALICVTDVIESARMRDELKFQATYDALTGCLNRASVTRALEQFLALPGKSATAVIFVDVDNSKPSTTGSVTPPVTSYSSTSQPGSKTSPAARTWSAASAATSSSSSAATSTFPNRHWRSRHACAPPSTSPPPSRPALSSCARASAWHAPHQA